jgi:beta-1,4-mannosyl-glycoprotein beta-1,4-N-acetylglucosaminyltransferase
MPKCSIVVPTYGKRCEDLLKPCLESIKKYSNLDDIEVIVVANGCTDNTKEYVESLGAPFKCVWYDEAIGYARASNAGMQQATGEFIVMLNNDTFLTEQPKNLWLDILMAPFINDEMMAITGPMNNWSESAQDYFLIGFCTMFRKSVLDKLGLYDESFDAYGEDTDLDLRIKAAGYKTRQVPDEAIVRSEKNPSIGIGRFPMVHRGNESYKNWPGGEALLSKNNKILWDRWGSKQPNISRARVCDGYMTEQELKWLGHEASQRKVIIEVGSWHGRSSRALGDNITEGGVIYCVDTWQGSQAEQDTNHASAKLREGDHALYEFMQNNMDLVQKGKIIPIRLTSKNAAALFKEEGLKADMIFIDAGHTYEEVCEDLDLWAPLLKDDGIYCGHDFCAWAGVNEAVATKLSNFFVGVGTTIWYCSKKDIRSLKPKVYDCFPFFNELDVLEARLEELWGVVDRFVISEATLTHGGKPKPLYFAENLERFKKYLSKITHIVVDTYPDYDNMEKPTDKSWYIERLQRDNLVRGLTECQDEDIIIISDCDEIPKAETVKKYNPANGLSAFSQDLYYYSLNCKSRDKWDWARILPYSIMKTMSPCQVRYVPNYDRNTQLLPDGGWHFSYLATVEGVIEKIAASAHQEYNQDSWKDPERVKKVIAEARDLFDRPLKYDVVAITKEDYPKYIYDNLETKYAQYVHK